MGERVRVLRVYEFTGPREAVEKQIAGSIHGEKVVGNGVIIRAATIGLYPEVIADTKEQANG